MTRFVLLISLALIPLIGSAQKPELKAGVIHVKVTPEFAQIIERNANQPRSAGGYVRLGNPALDNVNANRKVTSMRRLFRPAGKFEAAHQRFELHLWFEIQFDPEQPNQAIIEDYQALSFFQKVENVQNYSRIGLENTSKKVFGVLNGPTNDPLFDGQWHYKNTGQSGGTAGADVSLTQAWTVETGTPNVVVAIIDGGVDTNHPDLSGAMWVNIDEIAANGLDDDGNGYIDDIYGYGFGDNTGQIFPDFHGTHVGGTVGATTNNSVGVAGVAGGSGIGDGVRLMSCAGFGSFGVGGFEDAMVYAADNGAVISQNSWGGGSSAIESAIDYFIARAGLDNSEANFDNDIQIGPMAGGIVIFAAGNANSSSPFAGYPASYEPVMAVASTDHNDVRSVFSNFGSWVDIAAPGSGVYSTYPVSLGSYATLSGTSMACPHVSGAAALIVSKYGGIGFSPNQVWDRLTFAADNINLQNPGFIDLLGSGRLNAFNALQSNDGIPPSTILDLAISTAALKEVSLSWTAPGGSGTLGAASVYDLRYSTSPINESNFNSATRASTPKPLTSGSPETFTVTGLSHSTSYFFAIKASDFFGNVSLISNVVSASTLPPPVIEITPTSLSENLLTGATSVQFLNIHNTGLSDLVFEIKASTISTPSNSGASHLKRSASSIESNLRAPLLKQQPQGEYLSSPYRNTQHQTSRLSGEMTAPVRQGAGKLFIINSSTGRIQELDPTTGSIINSIALPEGPSAGPDGLAFDGEYLYFVNGFGTNSIHQIDPSNGSVISSVSFSVASLDALGHSGKYLYALDYSSDIIYEIDFENQLIVRQITPGFDIGGGLSFGGSRNTIFVNNFGVGIYEIDLESEEIVNSFIPTGTIYGLGYSEGLGLLLASNVSFQILEAYDPESGLVTFSYPIPNSAALASDEASGSRWLIPDNSVTLVGAGQSMQVPITFNATGLFGGLYTGNLTIASNDPVNPTIVVPTTLTVIGAPNIIASTDEINFGNVYLGATSQYELTISNNGTDDLVISDIALNHDAFSASSSGESLNPGESQIITIDFAPGTLGPANGTLVIQSNDPDQSELSISLIGNVVAAPVISATPTFFEVELEAGQTTTRALTISNLGGSNLSIEINLVDFVSPTISILNLKNSLPNNNGYVVESPVDAERYPLALGDITSKSASPVPLTAVSVNPATGIIYAQQNFGYNFYQYNPLLDVWSSLSPSPINSGNNGGATFLNGKVYTHYTGSNLIGVYDILSDSWTSVSSSVPFTGVIASDGANIYLIESFNFRKYNPSTATWQTLAAPPFPFTPWGGLQFSGSGFLYGHQGNSGVGYAKYNISTNSWTSLPQVPAGAVLGSAIDPVDLKYFAYGSYGGNNLYIFDLTSESWSLSTISTFAVNDGGMAYVGNSGTSGIYIIEGESGNRMIKYETRPLLNWIEVTPAFAMVEPAVSQDLTLLFNAEDLDGGVYTANLQVNSNDPINPTVQIPVTLNVIGAPDPIITVVPGSISKIMPQNSTSNETLTIRNPGGSTLDWTLNINGIGETSSLEGIRESLNENYLDITSRIPGKYDFFEGETGSSIVDGGNDMYDGGNYLSTNLGTLSYSNNAITSSPSLGVSGRYFTKKYPGLFVLVADVNNLAHFEINGNLGADGAGSVDATVLQLPKNGKNYSGFVKRVYNAFDPSVNHLIIIEGSSLRSHNYSTDTNDDFHRVGSLVDVDRIYYLLYAGSSGRYISNTETMAIMGAFLDQVNDGVSWLSSSQTSGALNNEQIEEVSLVFNTTSLPLGDYTAEVQINSNDPANPSISVPISLSTVSFVNSPPSLTGVLPNRTIEIGKFLESNMASIFSDPDDHPLTYTASSSNTIFATSSVLGSVLKVTAKEIGSVTITVTATDIFNASVTSSFMTTIVAANQAPIVVSAIPDGAIDIGGLPFVYKLSNAFSDPDNDPLTYRVVATNPSITEISLTADSLKVIGLAVGQSVLTITASDTDGASIAQNISLKVSTITAVEDQFNNNTIIVTPNPFSNEVIFSYQLSHAGYTSLIVFDIGGKKIEVLQNKYQEGGNHQVVFKSDDLPAGIYFYKLATPRGIWVGKIMKVE